MRLMHVSRNLLAAKDRYIILSYAAALSTATHLLFYSSFSHANVILRPLLVVRHIANSFPVTDGFESMWHPSSSTTLRTVLSCERGLEDTQKP